MTHGGVATVLVGIALAGGVLTAGCGPSATFTSSCQDEVHHTRADYHRCLRPSPQFRWVYWSGGQSIPAIGGPSTNTRYRVPQDEVDGTVTAPGAVVAPDSENSENSGGSGISGGSGGEDDGGSGSGAGSGSGSGDEGGSGSGSGSEGGSGAGEGGGSGGAGGGGGGGE